MVCNFFLFSPLLTVNSLLTKFHILSRSIVEQKSLLQMESSQQVFERVRDDTSSLLLQRDKDSLLSRQSSVIDDCDLNDVEFGFDRELLGSKPYLSAARSWMCQAARSRRRQSSSTTITARSLLANERDSVISDTSTLVVANDDDIEVMTVRSISVPSSDTTPLSATAKQPSKTKEKKNVDKKKISFIVPLIFGIPLVLPGSIRLTDVGQCGR